MYCNGLSTFREKIISFLTLAHPNLAVVSASAQNISPPNFGYTEAFGRNGASLSSARVVRNRIFPVTSLSLDRLTTLWLRDIIKRIEKGTYELV